jgi:hypothetical protein
VQDRRGRGGHIAVDEHRDARQPRRQDGAAHAGDLAPAEAPQHLQRIVELARMALDRPAHHVGLVRDAAGIEPGARPHPVLRPAAVQRVRDGRGNGGVADAHLADAQQIRPLGHRLHGVDHGGGTVGLLHRRIAVMSRVGCSSASS